MRSASTARSLRFAAGAATVAGLAWTVSAFPAVAADGPAEAGADLAFGQVSPVDGLRPGDTTGMSFTVKNRGDGPATNVALFLDGSQGLVFSKQYSNCIYEESPAQDEGPAQVNATCDIEQTLEPGVVYAPEEPVSVTLLDHAMYEHLTMNILADAISFPQGTQHGGGEDPVLRLVPQQPPADPGAAFGYSQLDVDISAENTADFALTGTDVKGKAGDIVRADVTFANKGPAWVRNDVGSPIGVFDVEVPTGTTVTEAPEFCLPDGSDDKSVTKAAKASVYHCTTPYNYADASSERPYVFKLRIDKVVANATGKVAFVKGDHRWGTLPFDRNPENNSAAIVVNASSGGVDTSHGSDSAGGASGGTPQGGITQNDMLADTGADSTLLIGGTAATVLLVGGGLILTSWRERTRPALRRSSADDSSG